MGILIYCTLDLTPLTSSIAIILLFLIGIWVSDEAERIIGKRDAPQIVIDEVVGAFLAIYLLPKRLGYIIGGFLLFRFFDIVKPYPIKAIDKKAEGGLGVMLDDLMAALYTNLALQGIRFLL